MQESKQKVTKCVALVKIGKKMYQMKNVYEVPLISTCHLLFKFYIVKEISALFGIRI